MRLAVFASGSGSNFEAIVNSTKDDSYAEVVVLITDKECYATKRAEALGIPYFTFDKSKKRKEYEVDVVKVLKDYGAEFIALAGYMNIIGQTLLDAFPKRIVNIHPSLLPKYRGLYAIERAVENKDDVIGITIHYVDKGIDTGEIIAQDYIKNNGESLEEITSNIHKIEHKLYVNTLKGLFK